MTELVFAQELISFYITAMAQQDVLVFSLSRLGPAEFSLDQPTRFQLAQDMVPDSLAAQRSAMPALAAGGFAGRVQADAARPTSGGATGGGLLALPQAFGSVYLGQAS